MHGGGDCGPMGSGSASLPDAKLIQCDEQTVLSIKPLGERIFGLIPFILGFWSLIAAFSCFFTPLKDASPDGISGRAVGGLLFLAVGLLFAGGGYSVIQPRRIRVGVQAGNYCVMVGWWPLRWITEGSVEKFSHLSVKSDPRSAKRATLFLHFCDPTIKPLPIHTGDPKQVEDYRLFLAPLLHLPRMDETKKPVSPEATRSARSFATQKYK